MNPIVMLTFNCLALTKDAIKSCLAQDIEGGVEILVIDTGSSDNTTHYLRTLHPYVSVVSVPKDYYVSKSWNLGLSYFFNVRKAPYVLVANNDSELRPDAMHRLVADGGQFVTCVGTSSGALFPGDEPKGTRRPHPDFSMFLVRRECWERVGPFDEEMAVFCSDGDMHIRMFQKGIEAYCLDVPFFHYASGTLKNVGEEDRQRILEQAAKDRAAFRTKWKCDMGSETYNDLFRREAVSAD